MQIYLIYKKIKDSYVKSKENHNRVVSLNVIKTRSLFSTNFEF